MFHLDDSLAILLRNGSMRCLRPKIFGFAFVQEQLRWIAETRICICRLSPNLEEGMGGFRFVGMPPWNCINLLCMIESCILVGCFLDLSTHLHRVLLLLPPSDRGILYIRRKDQLFGRRVVSYCFQKPTMATR